MKKFARSFSVVLVSAAILLGLSGKQSLVAAQEKTPPAPYTVPLFRHIDPTRPEPDFKAYQVIRFAVSDDFPPFSYRTKNGALSGFNVAIANALCKVLRVDCLFSVKPFNLANKAIASKEADAVITGIIENDQTAKLLSFTRPYYRFSARFAIRRNSPMTTNSTKALAGKRLGAVIGSQHARFLKENFRLSKLREFDNAIDAFEGLRTGAVDALFGDSLRLMFWIKGTASKNCCHFVGDAYVDLATFSQPMSIAVGPDNKKLRDLLDHALDRLQISGRYNKIFRQYFPLSPWQGDEAKTEGNTK